jgi:hypothetical protein
MEAAKGSHDTIVALLLSSGANVNATAVRYSGVWCGRV